MTLPFLPCHPPEVCHLGGLNRRANDLDVADLCGLSASLVVLEEYSEVHDVLELDKLEGHQLTFQVLGGQPGGERE